MCRACQAVTRAQPSFGIKFLEVQEHHPENGMFNLNYIPEVLLFSNIFTCSRMKLIRSQMSITVSYFKIVLSVWTGFFFIFNNFLIILNLIFNSFSELFIYMRKDGEKEKMDTRKVDRRKE